MIDIKEGQSGEDFTFELMGESNPTKYYDEQQDYESEDSGELWFLLIDGTNKGKVNSWWIMLD